MRLFYILGFLILLGSCKTKQELAKISLSPNNQIILLDSVEASTAIIQDESDGFFDKIQILEMSIQMKQEEVSADRNVVLENYKKYLQSDVEDFTESEKAYVSGTMQKAFEMCNQVDEDIYPERIRLIKTKGRHYGNSVYYTREDIIVIPEDVLVKRNPDAFLHVMLHEISHIYSRYNPEKRHQLYELIGFKPLDVMTVVPENLQKRTLYNPDGININYYMDLTTPEGKKIKVIPIIIATKDAYSNQNKAFFDYLQFQLYEIKYQQNNSYSVVTDERGFSTLDLRKLPDFFRQIKDNTQYIIHPDEIIADNFTYVIEASQNNYDFSKYSAEGQILLQQIKQVLKND